MDATQLTTPTTPISEVDSRPSSPESEDWDRWSGPTCSMCVGWYRPMDDWVSDYGDDEQGQEQLPQVKGEDVPCFQAVKDQRAYEVTRNRQKSFKEYTHLRNRRRGLDEELAEKVGWMPCCGYKVGEAPVPRMGRPRNLCDVDQEEWVATAYYRQKTAISKRRLRREEVEERDKWYGYGTKVDEKRGVEVSLEDLVVSTRQTRKAKKREHDFEFVPHMRAVVVLEDTKEVPVVEEPWEYIDSSDDEKSDMPTYAKVVKTVS